MRLTQFLAAGAAATLLLGAGGSAVAQRGRTAIDGIERGLWQLRGADGSARKVCVRKPDTLVQLRHGAMPCQHVMVENAANAVTMRYTCAGHGTGRTAITVETPRLVRVDTQGVIDGSPFSDDIEGRRIGNC